MVMMLAASLAVLAGCGGSSGTAGGDETSGDGAGGGTVSWPFFGRVPERTHYLPSSDRDLDPPLRQAWSINTNGLIEFPPAIANGNAYVINKFGNGKAIRLSDRKILWELQLDPKNHGKPHDVTAPAYSEGRVYGAFLDGYLAAGDAASGKKLWLDQLHAHLESSPLPVGDRLYIGTDKGEVLALDAASGKVLWKTRLPGAIKASPSYHRGRLYVADYESSMFALDADSGKVEWRSNTSAVVPFGEGGFFSSPAIAYGDVYAARDDGNVYAFDLKTGKVDWSFPTGAAVYGSPALATVPGTPPSVYIGAEDGTLFALGAASGKPRWHYDVGGAIPGTATVIGHTVYSSSFKTGDTLGIDALTHKKTFELHQAGYTPVVSDGRRLYLIGYFTVIGLDPGSR